MTLRKSMSPLLLDLLAEIIRKRSPRLESLLDKEVPLTTMDRETLSEILGAEFCETGLGVGDEPNRRGLQIEELIDRVVVKPLGPSKGSQPRTGKSAG